MALRLSTLGSDPDHPDENKAELTEHLAELRTRLIRACVYCAVGMTIMYVLFNPIYSILSAPITNALAKNVRKPTCQFKGIVRRQQLRRTISYSSNSDQCRLVV